jgi:hypothetical protein
MNYSQKMHQSPTHPAREKEIMLQDLELYHKVEKILMTVYKM